MSLIEKYAFKGVNIFLIFGDPISMVGDVLLLPASLDILNPEGIAYDMIHMGGGTIKAELEKVDSDSIGYGGLISTTAGFLSYENIFHLIIASYRNLENEDNLFALQQLVDLNESAFKMAEELELRAIISPVIGLENGYLPGMCAEAVLQGLIEFSYEFPNNHSFEKIFICSTDLYILHIYIETMNKLLFPNPTQSSYKPQFRTKKRRRITQSTEAAVIIVPLRDFVEIKKSLETADTDEFYVLYQSDFTVYLTDIKKENGRQVKDAIYMPPPLVLDEGGYYHFETILLRQLRKLFLNAYRQISIIVDLRFDERLHETKLLPMLVRTMFTLDNVFCNMPRKIPKSRRRLKF
ncbi:uncharacterized protein LOC106875213 [Octopus bimaculoides]|nr:uncharacterized protein LOC106875213 [Octopus bimaculoides]|eukprot:XP_014778747.1 PREDICTED: uncharacterized protein LOC106875213 [Octopus bimaculoides]